MVTRASVKLAGPRAVLRQGPEVFELHFEGAEPAILDISQPATPLDAPNPDARLVVGRSRADAEGRSRIRVQLGSPR
jgi:hypothetical protein